MLGELLWLARKNHAIREIPETDNTPPRGKPGANLVSINFCRGCSIECDKLPHVYILRKGVGDWGCLFQTEWEKRDE